MIRFVVPLLEIIIISLSPGFDIQGQKKPVAADSSVLAGIRFPREAFLDKRMFFNAAAKTVLEMEAAKYKINISDVEVYSFSNPTETIEKSDSLADTIIKFLKKSGYNLLPSSDDNSYLYHKQ